ncbi:unnamed protein product [Schistosoma curassoni]|uniref:HNH endonuclease n=1 Tax=Schistosoma curassoni TaxID=6186 RepID=A0A183L7G7_9TREM|nr:unnamed protein product [Schistosoma curassoni]
MMLELTTAHPEVARMKSPAGGCAYWSNIDARNNEYVTKCSARKKPRKTKMQNCGAMTNARGYCGHIKGK